MIIDVNDELFAILKNTLKDLCAIPSPSGYEDERAKYCLDFVKARGYREAYIDEAKNVVWCLQGKSDKTVLFTAHTDTVFPDKTPMPFWEDETYFKCPGVGDDTGALVPMIVASCELLKSGIKPEYTLVFSANSCEEGLGNLKGIKKLCETFSGKIDRMYSFDGRINAVNDKAVGSKRFSVTVNTKGGHSFNDFGVVSAIAVLSDLIRKIYAIEIPVVKGEKATYNVGVIEGGTSINTICQKASMLCEYRATSDELLRYMDEKFQDIFCEKHDGSIITVEQIGDRPCAKNVKESVVAEMTEQAVSIQRKYASTVKVKPASTDCNIPLSLGIPAICMGAYEGEGEHTREEWITKEGLKKGYGICLEIMEAEAKRRL